MCSIAAGLRSSRSTVACIASPTDAKKIRPKPFSRGNGEIFSSAEKIAASVPSLPARMLEKSFDTVTRPAFDQAGRPPVGHLRRMFANDSEDLLALGFERGRVPVGEAVSFPYRYDPTIRHNNFQ